jgi:hypothetical protein
VSEAPPPIPTWGREVRAIPELLSRIAAGWELHYCEPYEVSQSTGWCQFWLTDPLGAGYPVRAAIAIAAHRRGLIELRRDDARSAS